MGIGRSIKKLFGYDSKAHDKYINSMQKAQAAAYRDARSIEAASNMMLGAIGNIEAQAGYLREQAGGIRKASDEAYQIGLANAKNIMSETMEWSRRRGGQQKAEQSMNRAQAAASGIRLDTGGSSDIFREAVKREHTSEIDWGEKAGKSQADIATKEGVRARTEGYAMATGVEAQAEGAMSQIAGIQSGAMTLKAQAGATRTAGDLGLANARLAQSQANSGYKMNALSTAISIASLGYASGVIGGAGLGTAAKVGLGVAGVAGLASAFSGNGSSKPSDFTGGASFSTPEAKFGAGDVATVQGGAKFDETQLKAPTAGKGAIGLPSLAQASESTKRQYASKTLGKKDANIFGSTANPLATA